MAGRLIVIEGLDGAGTTTLTGLAVAALDAAGTDAMATANPSDRPLGELARRFLRHEVDFDERVAAMIFSGDRLDHARRVIEPALAAGTWVLCDRYYLSTLAYQGARIAAEHGTPLAAAIEWCAGLNRFVPRPEVTYFVNVARDERQRRMRDRPGDPERYDAGPTAAEVEAAYTRARAFLAAAGEEFVDIDGAPPPAQVAARLVDDVLSRER